MTNRKNKNTGRGLEMIIVTACIIFAIIGILAVKHITDTRKIYKELERENQELQDAYVSYEIPETEPEETIMALSDTSGSENENPEPEMEPEMEPEQFPISVDFENLRQINSNVIGWIYNEGTVINYPVVISSDNIYYLYHSIKGAENEYGTVFADSGNSPSLSDANTILYAHHMNDGSMFGTVTEYKKQEYYDDHPVMWFATPSQNYRVDIYSCYCTAADSEAYTLRFSDIDSYADWLTETIDKSVIETGIVPNISSHILTLSTCSYEFSGARTVAHGILVPVE